ASDISASPLGLGNSGNLLPNTSCKCQISLTHPAAFSSSASRWLWCRVGARSGCRRLPVDGRKARRGGRQGLRGGGRDRLRICPRRSGGPPPGGRRRQQAPEGRRFDRLGQVEVEARLARPLPLLVPAVAGQGDQEGGTALLAQLAG